MSAKMKYVAAQETPASLWHIESGPNGLLYEAQFIRRDAELIAFIHNECPSLDFEGVLAEIKKRGLSLAPAIGETATWIRRTRKRGIQFVDCKVIGYTPERVRIDAGPQGRWTVPPTNLATDKTRLLYRV